MIRPDLKQSRWLQKLLQAASEPLPSYSWISAERPRFSATGEAHRSPYRGVFRTVVPRWRPAALRGESPTGNVRS